MHCFQKAVSNSLFRWINDIYVWFSSSTSTLFICNSERRAESLTPCHDLLGQNMIWLGPTSLTSFSTSSHHIILQPYGPTFSFSNQSQCVATYPLPERSADRLKRCLPHLPIEDTTDLTFSVFSVYNHRFVSCIAHIILEVSLMYLFPTCLSFSENKLYTT